MAGKRAQFRAGFSVPKFDLLVVAAGGQNLPVGRKRESVNCVLVAGDRSKWFSIGHVPHVNFSTDADIAARTVECFTVARKDHALAIDEDVFHAERELVWLAYVEGSSHREIAEIMGLREVSIRPMLFRVRQKLAELLKSIGYCERMVV